MLVASAACLNQYPANMTKNTFCIIKKDLNNNTVNNSSSSNNY